MKGRAMSDHVARGGRGLAPSRTAYHGLFTAHAAPALVAGKSRRLCEGTCVLAAHGSRDTSTQTVTPGGEKAGREGGGAPCSSGTTSRQRRG